MTLFIAVGAIGDAVMMWMAPTGVSWGGEPMLDLLRAKMPWPDVLFKIFIPSSYALLAVNGLSDVDFFRYSALVDVYRRVIPQGSLEVSALVLDSKEPSVSDPQDNCGVFCHSQ